MLGALWLAVVANVKADVPVTSAEANTIRSIDVTDYHAKSFELDGKIVKLKFNRRDSTVAKQDGGGLHGSIGLWKERNTTNPKYWLRTGLLPVKVPEEGVEWFMKIPTTYESRGNQVVFVRVHAGKTGEERVELLGREMKTDSKGSRIIW
jgi:hypothetical protein